MSLPKKSKTLILLLRITGFLGLVISMYSMLRGNPFSQYWSGLVLGIGLFGVAAVLSYRERRE